MTVGRPPEIGEARTEWLRVRLAPSELAKIDAERGDQTRSDYVRDAIDKRIREKK